MDQHTSVVSDGLKIVHVPMGGVRSVTVAIFINLGSRYEGLKTAGSAHLIEHMLFKGTPRRPGGARISAAIDSVGGVLNASTDKETTAFWAKVSSDDTAVAIDLLGDMLQNSRMTATDLARERSVVLEELSMLVDDPEERVHTAAEELLWPDQPVGREVAGNRESVALLRRRDLTWYMDRFYGRNNATISVAGGFPVHDTLRLIEEHFDNWQHVSPQPAAPAFFSSGHSRVRVDSKDIEQVHVCVMFPAVPRTHPDRWALEVLCTILGGGTSSRLFNGLREQKGLAYDVHAYATFLSDTGAVTVYAATDRAKLQSVVVGLFCEIARLQRRRVFEAELERAKQFMRGRLWLGLEDTLSVAHWFGAHAAAGEDELTPELANQAIESISADDLLRVARTHLGRDTAHLAAVGPTSEDTVAVALSAA